MYTSLQRFRISIINQTLILMGYFVLVAWASAANSSVKRILVMGYSLSAGYQLEKSQAFPALLERKFLESGIKIEFLNAGVSGDTTLQGLNRLPWVLKKGGRFDFVLLELGANDGLRGLETSDMKKNLESMIQIFHKENIKIFLLGMRITANRGTDYQKKFESVFADLSKRKEIAAFDPFFLEEVVLKPELNLGDFLHPNISGHQKIAERLFPHIKKLLKRH